MVEKHIRGTGTFLVEVRVRPGNDIRVHVDRPEGISIEACARISRYIHEMLDRDAEDYALEVSSPGLGTPFRVKQQYEKNVGHEIEVLLLEGVKFSGKLLEVSEKGILVDVKGNQKNIDFDAIKTSKEVLTFN